MNQIYVHWMEVKDGKYQGEVNSRDNVDEIRRGQWFEVQVHASNTR